MGDRAKVEAVGKWGLVIQACNPSTQEAEAGINQESSNVATALGFRSSFPPYLNLLDRFDGSEGHAAGVARAFAASEASGRGVVPRSCLSLLASRSSDADLGTRAGRGPGYPPPPAGESPGPARGEVPSAGTRARRAPRRAARTVAQRSSHVARPPAPASRLRYGPQARSPGATRDPASVALAYAALSLPLSCSLQPGARVGDAGGDGGLLRNGRLAVHSALGPAALLHSVLGQGKLHWDLRGPLRGQWKQAPEGPDFWEGIRIGHSNHSNTPLSPTSLHPHPWPKPPFVSPRSLPPDHDQKGIGVKDPTRGFQGIGPT